MAITEEKLNMFELQECSIPELNKHAQALNIQGYSSLRRQELIFAILQSQTAKKWAYFRTGCSRHPRRRIWLPQIAKVQLFARSRRHLCGPLANQTLQPANRGTPYRGHIRPPRGDEKYFALIRVEAVNFENPEVAKQKILFDNLTPLHPDQRIDLEYDSQDLSTRIMNLLTPIGKGQRGMIVAPPFTGKTMLLQKIANAITQNHPEITLIVLLIDERPEEVTDMTRSVEGEVVSSTFDEPPTRHVQVADMVIEKAKRLVEHQQDVVILLDSITRLARAYNTVAPHSGRVLTGGLDSTAMQWPKRFFWRSAQHRRRRQLDHPGNRPRRNRKPYG